jgi:hypothetical protein
VNQSSQKALAEAQNNVNTLLEEYNENLKITTTTTTGASSANDKAAEKTKKFKDELKNLNDSLKDSIEKTKEYATGISDSFVDMLSLGDAFDTFTDRQTKVTETLAALTKFQTDIQGEATEDQKANLLSLQKAYQDASADAANGAQSIVEEFVNQGKKLSEFTTNMNLLLSKNLSRAAFDTIIAAGVDRGADIADALAQGNIDANIANVNAVYTSVAAMGQQVGNQASGNFMMQGVVLAQSMLVGLIKEFMPAGKKRRELLDSINGMVSEAVSSMASIANIPMPSFTPSAAARVVAPGPASAFDFTNPNWFGDAVRAGIDPLAGLDALMGGIPMMAAGGPVSSGRPYIVGEVGPELFVPSSSGNIMPNNEMGGKVINLTVNAGMGTQGAEVGRQIVDALKAYERRNGSVYVSA